MNEGEVPHYYVENSHPAIISPETFELVQSEIRKRKESGYQGGGHLFAGKIICEKCGTAFGRKVWQSTNQYRRTVWQCNAKYPRGQRGAKCNTPHVTEQDIQVAFVQAFNQLIENKDRYITEFEEVLPLIADTEKLEHGAIKLVEERDVTSELIRRCVEDNARAAQNQKAYSQKYNDLATRYETAQKRLNAIAIEKEDLIARKESALRFLDTLQEVDNLISKFDVALWNATVDFVTVHAGNVFTVAFRDGKELRVEL